MGVHWTDGMNPPQLCWYRGTFIRFEEGRKEVEVCVRCNDLLSVIVHSWFPSFAFVVTTLEER